ncbi:MAG: hypothetical protein IJQ58_00380 [Synergistaceae bacterium]|nr:hypothetical protein [Synergistaceae bacterium]
MLLKLENLCAIHMESFSTGLEVQVAVMFDMLWERILSAVVKQIVLE